MAGFKISELTELSMAESADLLAIVDDSEVSIPIKTKKITVQNLLNSVEITDVDELKQSQIDQGDPTGFIDPDNIDVSYSSTDRKITLTHSSGYIYYYWKGEKKSLTSPWVSSVHDDDGLSKFLLTSDGINFTWSNSSWSFKDVMVAYVLPGKIFALRETHGLMPWQVHDIWHRQLGTFRVSGGGLIAGTFVLNSPIDADCNPSFAACVIRDEDITTSLPLWPENTYTHLWFTGSGTVNWSTTEVNIVKASGSYAFVNIYSGGTFTYAATVNNRYINYYVIRFPVTSDTESQKYRAVVLQPQNSWTSLSAAQSESFTNLYLGQLTTLATEFVVVEKLTYYTQSANTNTGKVQLVEHTIVVGAKASQTTVSGISPTSAENVSFVPTGDIAAVNVQTAIAEVDSEKLKRAGNDFTTFTAKSSYDNTDIILIEDSIDSYNKKKITRANLIGAQAVYGTQYQYASSDAVSSTTSTAFAIKVNLTTPTLPAGNYHIGYTCELANSNGQNEVEVQVQIDDTTTITTFRKATTNNNTIYVPYSSFYNTSLTNAIHSIDLDYRAIATTAYIRNARLEIWRVS